MHSGDNATIPRNSGIANTVGCALAGLAALAITAAIMRTPDRELSTVAAKVSYSEHLLRGGSEITIDFRAKGDYNKFSSKIDSSLTCESGHKLFSNRYTRATLKNNELIRQATTTLRPMQFYADTTTCAQYKTLLDRAMYAKRIDAIK